MKTTSKIFETEHTYAVGDRVKIDNLEKAEKFLRPLYRDIDECESFHVIALNRANEVVGHKEVSFGNTYSCIADPKQIFRFALSLKGVCGIIVSHNHPSGNMKASEQDNALTRKLVEGGKVLEISVLDHVIMHPVSGNLSII